MTASDPWSSGVLKPETHDRLVANIATISNRAGLGMSNRHMIWTSADLKKAEMQWCEAAIMQARSGEPWQQPVIGICYTVDQLQAEQTMMAMTGLLVRNFVDARCISRNDALIEYKENKTVEASALLIPDFGLPEYIETMPKWEKTGMMEVLHERVRMQLPTCVFVGASMNLLKTNLPSVHADLMAAFKIEGD